MTSWGFEYRSNSITHLSCENERGKIHRLCLKVDKRETEETPIK